MRKSNLFDDMNVKHSIQYWFRLYWGKIGWDGLEGGGLKNCHFQAKYVM